MTIGPAVRGKMVEMVERLLMDHLEAIDEAYRRQGELTVSLPIKLSPEKGYIGVKAGITFVAEKVKDEITELVDEDQQNLFNQGEVAEMEGEENVRETLSITGGKGA